MKNKRKLAKTLYYKQNEYFIVHEFDGKLLISANKDFSKCFCVNINEVSIKKNNK